MLAITTVGVLALAGLVVDGGALLAARGRAADLVEQTARAGTSAITPASLRGPSLADLRINPGAAQRPGFWPLGTPPARPPLPGRRPRRTSPGA